MLTTIILIVVMLLLSAFFSGMEIAFTSKNRLKLEIDRKQSRFLLVKAISMPEKKADRSSITTISMPMVSI